MHTVWMREHNRIAKFFQFQNPQWSDEKLFQEARRLVIAQYQHIIYKEWMPLIVGSELMTSFGLWPLSKGYSNQYIDSFDPRVTNEFATAAFRFGHSLIPSKFTRSIKTNPRTGKDTNGRTQTLSMKDIFFKPDSLKKSPTLMDDLVRGLAQQNGDMWDNVFSDDITNHLFESRRFKGGLDLVALNIQRGRDHGIAGYNSYRELCGVGKARNFEDLADYMTEDDVQRLKSLYSDVDDVDLFVGGFLERRHLDSILGPTFKCIIADTFARLKIGDRFFYDLNGDAQFSPEQLEEIRKSSMARVLCDNTDNMDAIQPQAFKMSTTSSKNAVVSCNDFNAIPELDLKVFV